LLKTPGRNVNGSTIGLKRPSTAINSSAKTSASVTSTPTPNRTRPGLKPPSAVNSIQSKIQSKLAVGIKQELTKTPLRRTTVVGSVGPVSIEKD
jgi:hypothetical protein